MTRTLLAAFGLALLIGPLAPSHAHQASDAYLTLTPEAAGTTWTARIDVALRDLDREFALDTDDDGALRWREVRDAWPRVQAWMQDGVRWQSGDARCTATFTGVPQLDDHGAGTYAVLTQRLACPGGGAPTSVRYGLFATRDAGHRGLLRMQSSAGAPRSGPIVLVPDAKPQLLAPMASPATGDARRPDGFTAYVVEGITHIGSGLDHLLFLSTLVLVTVFRRAVGRADAQPLRSGASPVGRQHARRMGGSHWVAQPSRRAVIVEALRIVTAFTLTHSVTLGLAAAGVLAPPSRAIESLIAASVLVAALDNLKPVIPWPRWVVAGLFGFVHGFGFAGPLQDLGLRGRELVMPLLGFNLGVEAGQLLVLAVTLPAVLAWRDSASYRGRWMPAASGAVAVLAGVWLVERVFDLSLTAAITG